MIGTLNGEMTATTPAGSWRAMDSRGCSLGSTWPIGCPGSDGGLVALLGRDVHREVGHRRDRADLAHVPVADLVGVLGHRSPALRSTAARAVCGSAAHSSLRLRRRSGRPGDVLGVRRPIRRARPVAGSTTAAAAARPSPTSRRGRSSRLHPSRPAVPRPPPSSARLPRRCGCALTLTRRVPRVNSPVRARRRARAAPSGRRCWPPGRRSRSPSAAAPRRSRRRQPVAARAARRCSASSSWCPSATSAVSVTSERLRRSSPGRVQIAPQAYRVMNSWKSRVTLGGRPPRRGRRARHRAPPGGRRVRPRPDASGAPAPRGRRPRRRSRRGRPPSGRLGRGAGAPHRRARRGGPARTPSAIGGEVGHRADRVVRPRRPPARAASISRKPRPWRRRRPAPRRPARSWRRPRPRGRPAGTAAAAAGARRSRARTTAPVCSRAGRAVPPPGPGPPAPASPRASRSGPPWRSASLR